MISVVIISKDEPALDGTLNALRDQVASLDEPAEILVVDASDGRLDHIKRAHEPDVRWIQFQRPPGAGVTIPHQRNAGVRAAAGDIIAFTDSGCYPADQWLARLTAPLRADEADEADEHVTAGPTFSLAEDFDPYSGSAARQARADEYLKECPTINLAFRREAFEAVDGFDETFAYGSDIDFSWRLRDAGYRIKAVPDAGIRTDWGTWRRQLRRAYAYGKARARLYRKHPSRRRHVLRDDPMVVVYPVFLLGLPLTFVFPLYPALLIIPAWRNRSLGIVKVLTDHLAYGAGVLAGLANR
jgi:cellulose synthase/poly-beta-1,6-N-acetylglucosamine synthase-like glycosyltransferase